MGNPFKKIGDAIGDAFDSAKDRFTKILPNEVGQLLSTAAPFVTPFNPILGATMAGIGSLDQTGSLTQGIKRGLGSYAMGQGLRYLGGAGFQPLQNPFATGGAFTPAGFTSGFSSPFGTETGIGSLFKSDPVTVADNPYALQGEGAYSFDTLPEAKQVSSGSFVTSQPQVGFEAGQVDPQLARAAGLDTTSTATQAATSTSTNQALTNKITEDGLKKAGTTLKDFMKAKLPEKGKIALDWFKGLDGSTKLALGIGTASAALQFLENKGREKERSDFALFRDRPTDFYNLQYRGGQQAKDGGIIGLANGGEPAMEMDYRGGGFIPVGAKERADDVPARLSKNEFVMTADAVRAAGGGSVDLGAQRMYDLMNRLEAQA